ncbi:hypothetical protein LIER_03468 [Lithospermum erythrorhizon]|uniref:Uncharacterized protein n=1 Tax=Lithospermum erythrorhizon TaxID=34254 RepID=A0AAV3NX62_LITER
MHQQHRYPIPKGASTICYLETLKPKFKSGYNRSGWHGNLSGLHKIMYDPVVPGTCHTMDTRTIQTMRSRIVIQKQEILPLWHRSHIRENTFRCQCLRESKRLVDGFTIKNDRYIPAHYDALVAKFATAVQKRQDEWILMDIQQGKNESLRAYHGGYNNLLLNDKVAYMSFFKGLRYGKMKKALLVQTPLTNDELTAVVTTHIELEELKVCVDQPADLRETLLKKDRNVLSKKSLVWERI